MVKFIPKHNQSYKPSLKITAKPATEIKEEKSVMTTQEKVELANQVLSTPKVKRIKKEKGLIERTESSKTILTEDNKELLID